MIRVKATRDFQHKGKFVEKGEVISVPPNWAVRYEKLNFAKPEDSEQKEKVKIAQEKAEKKNAGPGK